MCSYSIVINFVIVINFFLLIFYLLVEKLSGTDFHLVPSEEDEL